MAGNKEFILSLVVAVADNGVIGREGQLPWRLKSDLRRFRQLTLGHPMIMGGITWRAIGRPLDGRDTIVLTRNAAKIAAEQESVFVAPDWEEAEALAKVCAKQRGATEIFVIGGASIYGLAMPHSDRIYLSRVHGSPTGDVHWDAALGSDWEETSRVSVPAGPEDEYPVSHLIIERKQNN